MTKKKTKNILKSNVAIEKVSTAQQAMLLRDSTIDPELRAQMQ